jgi:predicted ATPase
MDYIEIQGYKSIKGQRIDLKNINILIGANGGGKSNFLSFFEFLKNIYQQNLREYVALRGSADKFLHKGDKVTKEISVHLKFDRNGYSFTLKKGEQDFIFTNEGLWYDTNPYYQNPLEIATFNTESNLRNNVKPRAGYIREYLNALEKYHFHDVGENSPFNKESNMENDKFSLYGKGQNLAAYLFAIYNEDRIVYDFIVKTIQSVAPYFLDFIFKPESNGNIRLRCQSRYSPSIYGVNDLSDGTIRFIALTTLFMQPHIPQTIIIDEPELGLHPTAIAKLAGMIQSAAAKSCQVILATQSTDLIGHFKPEDIITVDQINGETIFKRLDADELAVWLENYTIDDLWKRNIITSGQPNYIDMQRIIIICEGYTEQEFCNKTLLPHFAMREIDVKAPRTKKSNGGIANWSALKEQIENHLKQDPACSVSLFIDYYGIYAEHNFPAWEEASKIADKNDRLSYLEQKMKDDIDEKLRYRFIPYMQLREFEGLLFNDINIFHEQIPAADLVGLPELQSAFDQFTNPEMINSTRDNAPSKRLQRIIKDILR